jgi:uncharacterized protein
MYSTLHPLKLQFSRFFNLRIFVFFIGLFSIIGLQAEQTLPKVQGLVNDYANVLNADQYAQLTKKLRALEDTTGIQIAVVFERSHEGYGAFDRAMFLARGWDVGDKNDRSGILMYIAVDDRDYYTVTSDRTQGKLPDGFVGIVAQDYFKPNFRKNDYYTGVDQATDAFIQAMNGEFKRSNRNGYTYTYTSEHTGWVALFLGLFIPFLFFFIVWKFFKAIRRGVTVGGGNSGCLNAILLNAALNSGRSSSWGSSSSSDWGSSSSSSDWGGFGGGGSGFNGGGAGGSW